MAKICACLRGCGAVLILVLLVTDAISVRANPHAAPPVHSPTTATYQFTFPEANR